tara:strand:- start:2473 stop:2751 length:279 start_codon:yes stop_codon:yes gene_type:complete
MPFEFEIEHLVGTTVPSVTSSCCGDFVGVIVAVVFAVGGVLLVPESPSDESMLVECACIELVALLQEAPSKVRSTYVTMGAHLAAILDNGLI